MDWTTTQILAVVSGVLFLISFFYLAYLRGYEKGYFDGVEEYKEDLMDEIFGEKESIMVINREGLEGLDEEN